MSEIMRGYKQDSFGRLVPIEAIDKIDLLRDQTVSKIVQSGLDMQEKMTQWKRQALDDIVAFCELSAKNYGVKWGGKKGNLSLVSYDGRYKVLIAVSDSLAFDERLQVAKSLIDECIREWTKNSNTEIKTLVEHAFQTDKQGNINVGRIFGLMRVKIEHPKWIKAMEALKDSIQVTATSQYLRLYQRVGDTDKYEQIPMDLARL